MKWKRRAVLAGVISGAVTFVLLAPFSCQTHYADFVPGGWEIEMASTSCEGLVAFEYGESRRLVGPKTPEGGQFPRPSLLQPQTLITSAIVGALTALIVWLLGSRPQVGPSARAIISVPLLTVTFLAGTSPGGAIIYAAPVLIPLFWWMAYQASLPARIGWAVLASLVAVEAVALITYGTRDFWVAVMLLSAGLATGMFVLTANRGRTII